MFEIIDRIGKISNPLRECLLAFNYRYTSIMNKIINKYNDSPSLYKIIKCCALEDAEFLRHTDFQRHRDNQNGFGWTLLHHAAMEGKCFKHVAATILPKAGKIRLEFGCKEEVETDYYSAFTSLNVNYTLSFLAFSGCD